MQCRIAVLDNDPITLTGLSSIINSSDIGKVIWTSQSDKETIQLCFEPNSKPDALMVDMSLGVRSSGSAVCKTIRRRTASIPILAITAFPLHVYAKDAAMAGAQGIVSKADSHQIICALRAVLQGSTWGRNFNSAAISHLQLKSRPRDILLSQRETEIMNMLSKGMFISDIAIELHISESTIKTMITRSKRKLGTSSMRKAIAVWTGECDGQ